MQFYKDIVVNIVKCCLTRQYLTRTCLTNVTVQFLKIWHKKTVQFEESSKNARIRPEKQLLFFFLQPRHLLLQLVLAEEALHLAFLRVGFEIGGR